jgi:ubiquinone/menaquinone biosynthesis C-methylase UbiE
MQIRPVTRSKTEARAAYNQMSPIYDWLAGASETPLMQLGLDMLAVGKGESVLEIGSGTGKALAELVNKVGETGTVYGIDLSPGMLHQAQIRFFQSSTLVRVYLAEGDGVRLPYQSESFNAIFISFTLELFDTPEIPSVLEECLRVLLPGGRLGVVAMFKTGQPGRMVRLYEWFHDHFPTYVDCRPIGAAAQIQAAGFWIEDRQQKSMWGLPVEMVIAQKK